jgi:penicillin amidase
MDGSQLELDWQAYIPQSQNAHVLNPVRGFVSSANQYPVDSTYPYYVYDDSYEHYRNRRINAQLNEMGNKITPQDMMRLQNDTYNLHAAESLPLMLDSLDLGKLDAQQKDLFDVLRNWDYRFDTDKTAPSIFDAWWNNLYLMIWDEFDPEKMALDYPSTANTLFIMKNYPEDTCFDMVNTTIRENFSDVLQLSFNKTVKELAQWLEENNQEYTWGTYKGTFIRHLLRLEPFSHYQISVGGGRHVISANKKNHGQSWKMVVELGNPVRAWGVYPGGQSGNPGSYYYDNMIDDWANGTHYPMLYLYNTNDKRNAIMFSQSFQP